MNLIRRVTGPQATRTRERRRGSSLFVALAALAICAALAGVAVRYQMLERAALAAEARRSQAHWLAEAALERAAAQIVADRDYHGETWNPSADQGGGLAAARAQITVAPASGEELRRVTVTVDYPFPSAGAARQVTRSLNVQPPQR